MICNCSFKPGSRKIPSSVWDWFAGLALTAYVVITSDAGSRWSYNLTQQYLTMEEHPDDLNGWLPDNGGVFYSADMTLFYQTFYKNPKANWRYILGFESTFMPDEDFKVLLQRDVEWR